MSLRKILFLLLPVLVFQSCRLVGLNFKHKPPKKPGTYKKFTESDSLRGYYGPLRQNNDVTFYQLHIKPDASKKTLSGHVSIHFTAVAGMEQMQLDLQAEMVIESITMDGQNLGYERRLNSFFVRFNTPLKKGEQKVMTIKFAGKPHAAKRPPWEGGLVWKKDKNKNPWIGVACENDKKGMWWPCKEHIADEPDSVHISIETPGGLMAVSNGKLLSVETSGQNKVYTWGTSYSINPYNITFYVGDFKKLTLPCPRCTIDSTENYVLSYNYEKARAHFRQTAPIIKFYEETFGPYPWPNDGFKLVESPYEGMEHQSAIAYGNGYKNTFQNTDYIILHEAAHEWWGNSISVGDFADVWIHEGFATYCEALFVEKIYGHTAMEDYVSWQGISVKNKLPVVGPRDVGYWDYKDGDPYNKGSVMLHSLRNTLQDDDLFMKILRTFYQQNARSMVNTQMFIEHVNRMTGKDYGWFFKQYLYRAQIPVLEVCFKKNSDLSVSVFYRWTKTDDDFVMPVDLEIDNQSILLYPNQKWQEYRTEGRTVFLPRYNFYYYLKTVKRLGP